MAEVVYKTAVCLLLFILLAAGTVDLGLYLEKKESVSAWLRANPPWFTVPACAMCVFLFVLSWHLFGHIPKAK
jgi:hypothetical protein